MAGSPCEKMTADRGYVRMVRATPAESRNDRRSKAGSGVVGEARGFGGIGHHRTTAAAATGEKRRTAGLAPAVRSERHGVIRTRSSRCPRDCSQENIGFSTSRVQWTGIAFLSLIFAAIPSHGQCSSKLQKVGRRVSSSPVDLGNLVVTDAPHLARRRRVFTNLGTGDDSGRPARRGPPATVE